MATFKGRQTAKPVPARSLGSERYFAIPLSELPREKASEPSSGPAPVCADFGKRNEFGFPITGRR